MSATPSVSQLISVLDQQIENLIGDWNSPREPVRYDYKQAAEIFIQRSKFTKDHPSSDGVEPLSNCYEYEGKIDIGQQGADAFNKVSRYFLPIISSDTQVPATVRAYAHFLMAIADTSGIVCVENAIKAVNLATQAHHTDTKAYYNTALHLFNLAYSRAILIHYPEASTDRTKIYQRLGEKDARWVQCTNRHIPCPFKLNSGISEKEILARLPR